MREGAAESLLSLAGTVEFAREAAGFHPKSRLRRQGAHSAGEASQSIFTEPLAHEGTGQNEEDGWRRGFAAFRIGTEQEFGGMAVPAVTCEGVCKLVNIARLPWPDGQEMLKERDGLAGAVVTEVDLRKVVAGFEGGCFCGLFSVPSMVFDVAEGGHLTGEGVCLRGVGVLAGRIISCGGRVASVFSGHRLPCRNAIRQAAVHESLHEGLACHVFAARESVER